MRAVAGVTKSRLTGGQASLAVDAAAVLLCDLTHNRTLGRGPRTTSRRFKEITLHAYLRRGLKWRKGDDHRPHPCQEEGNQCLKT